MFFLIFSDTLSHSSDIEIILILKYTTVSNANHYYSLHNVESQGFQEIVNMIHSLPPDAPLSIQLRKKMRLE